VQFPDRYVCQLPNDSIRWHYYIRNVFLSTNQQLMLVTGQAHTAALSYVVRSVAFTVGEKVNV